MKGCRVGGDKLKTQDVVYKILQKLDETLDENNPDFTDLSPDHLG